MEISSLEKSTNMQSYIGPTLTEALDAFRQLKRSILKLLRLLLQDVNKIECIGIIPVGRFETVIIMLCIIFVFAQKGVLVEYKSVEMHHVAV